MNDNMLILIFVTIVVIMLIAGIIIYKKPKLTKQQMRIKRDKKHRKYIAIYYTLSKNRLTQGKVKDIANQIKKLALFKKEEIYYLTATFFIRIIVITSVFFLISLVVFDDVVTIILMTWLGYVVGNVSIVKKLDNINYKVYEQLRMAVGTIREEYMKTNSVTESLMNAEYGSLIYECFQNLNSILMSANIEERLNEFYVRMPFRLIQTIASICYDVENAGDEISQGGESSFIISLMAVSEEINTELEKMNYIKARFGVLQYVAIVPLVSIPIIEKFWTSTIPATGVLYQGFYGYIVRIMIIIVGIGAYDIISRINVLTTIASDDRIKLYVKLEQNPLVRWFCRKISAKGIKRRKLQLKFKHALTKKTIEQFYLDNVTFVQKDIGDESYFYTDINENFMADTSTVYKQAWNFIWTKIFFETKEDGSINKGVYTGQEKLKIKFGYDLLTNVSLAGRWYNINGTPQLYTYHLIEPYSNEDIGGSK